MVKKTDSIKLEDMENLEGRAFKKDGKPYLVFACTKCGQYSYVKLIQKGKKCLRCGRTHQVRKLKNSGEIVNGISTAVEMVKKRQNELAIDELGGKPDLLTSQSFKKARESSFSNYKEENEGLDQYEEFKRLLIKKTKRFTDFPRYVIELVAEESGLTKSEREKYLRILIKKRILISLDKGKYKFNYK